MALLEKGKCVEIQKENYEQTHSCHFSHNWLIRCLKTTCKTTFNLFGSILIVSYLISSSLCILREDISRAHLTSALLAGAGLSCTILGIFSSKFSVTGGTRLGYLICVILFLNQPSQKCPGNGDLYAMGLESRTKEWQTRFQMVQEGVLMVSIVQIFVGITGIDVIVKYIRPVSVVPTLILLSSYVMQTRAHDLVGSCWKLFLFSLFLMCLFYFVFHQISKRSRNKTGLRQRMFVGFVAVVLLWTMCALFSKFELLRLKNAARTDVYNGALLTATPFRIPYTFQWGLPKFRLNTFFVMLPGVYISLFEILANYYIITETELRSTFQINGNRKKLLNRNTLSLLLILEGILSLLIGSLAPGLCLTVDMKSRSRRLPGIITGIIMMAAAFSGIFCALVTTIPGPIVSAFIYVIFLSICLEGFSLLQCINLNSSRNHCILGISLFSGLVIPKFVNNISDTPLIGVPWADELFWSIMSTEFLIGGTVAVILDNLAEVFLGPDTEPKLDKTKERFTDSADSMKEKSPSVCDCLLSIFV